MEILDENRISVIQGVSNTDNETLIPICANTTMNALCVDNNITGSGVDTINDARDEDRKVAFMAVSAVDGVTPVAIYADSLTSRLLINSN